MTAEQQTGTCRGCHQERALAEDGTVVHHEVAALGACDGSDHHPLGPRLLACAWTARYRVDGRDHARIPFYADKGTYALRGTLSEARAEAEPHIRARLAELNDTTPDRIHRLSFSICAVTRGKGSEDVYGVYTKPVPEYTIRKGPRGDNGAAAHAF
ncbi:hypothetical protein [Streptomyces griseus]|uniref:hypothetical protein n=1 Tax=Streptomyces griseus TaxID=1911 RepID=UPI00364A9AAE